LTVLSLIVNLVEVRLGAWARIKERDRRVTMFANAENAVGGHRKAAAHRLVQRCELGNHPFHATFPWRPNEVRVSCGATLYGSQTQFYTRERAPSASGAC